MFLKYNNNKMHLILIIILTVLICLVCLIGDYLIEANIFSNNRLIKCIVDNSVHAIVGTLTWILIINLLNNNDRNISDNIFQIIICTLIASFIDLDHFIAARSFKLHDATSLSERPFLHNTTLIVLLGSFVILLSYLYPILHPWGWVWLAAAISHHTRDATRRGYTFSPWGSTAPIPKYVYIGILAILPQIIAFCIYKTKPRLKKYIDEGYVQTV